MIVKTVQSSHGTERSYFDEVPSLFTDFKSGMRVLPAQYFDDPASCQIFFVKKHEPNTPVWPDGGYECVDGSNGFRAFHLNSLIVHPQADKSLWRAYNLGDDLTLPIKKISIGSGKRGRPSKYPPGESPSDLKKKERISNGPALRRGRKQIYLPGTSPSAIKKQLQQVNRAGGKRGRPSKYRPGESPSDLKKKEYQDKLDAGYVPKRGRPAKQ